MEQPGGCGGPGACSSSAPPVLWGVPLHPQDREWEAHLWPSIPTFQDFLKFPSMADRLT